MYAIRSYYASFRDISSSQFTSSDLSPIWSKTKRESPESENTGSYSEIGSLIDSKANTTSERFTLISLEICSIVGSF